jgi:hypothetical protein
MHIIQINNFFLNTKMALSEIIDQILKEVSAKLDLRLAA